MRKLKESEIKLRNKTQYNLERISALSSGNVRKYEFLTWKDILPEKDLLEKTDTIKRFEYLPLGRELKAETDNAKKLYQKFDTYEFDRIIKKEKTMFEKYNRSNLIDDSKYSFYPYYNIKNVNSLSLTSKYSILFLFSSESRWFVGLKLIQLKQQKTQLSHIILAKNLKPVLCRVIKFLNWK